MCFDIFVWAINFIIKSITRSSIKSNIMMENENISFANISIPCCEHDLRTGVEVLAKSVFWK